MLKEPPVKAHKGTKTRADYALVNHEVVESWERPFFQRPININRKVKDLASHIAASNPPALPGVIWLAVYDGRIWIVDGQHRKKSFLISGVPEAFADIMYFYPDSLAEMGQKFRDLNRNLVSMEADDQLRSLEEDVESLKEIRRVCPFIVYGREKKKKTTLSMSVAIRAWFGALTDIPTWPSEASYELVTNLNKEMTEDLTFFMNLCHSAWGDEPRKAKLWGFLNLIVCAWLYRRLVLSPNSSRSVKLTAKEFQACLVAIGNDQEYVDWLVGRNVAVRDRSPCYTRVKSIIVDYLAQANKGVRPSLPAPDWAAHLS